MPIMSKPSSGPRTALTFITIGSILTIWMGVMMARGTGAEEPWKTIVLALFLTGLAFLVIGFSVGYIGRAARNAELPPQEALNAMARTERAAAAQPPAPAPAPQPQPQPPANVPIPPTSVYQAGPGSNP